VCVCVRHLTRVAATKGGHVSITIHLEASSIKFHYLREFDFESEFVFMVLLFNVSCVFVYVNSTSQGLRPPREAMSALRST
jgi:hypothetical protein